MVASFPYSMVPNHFDLCLPGECGRFQEIIREIGFHFTGCCPMTSCILFFLSEILRNSIPSTHRNPLPTRARNRRNLRGVLFSACVLLLVFDTREASGSPRSFKFFVDKGEKPYNLMASRKIVCLGANSVVRFCRVSEKVVFARNLFCRSRKRGRGGGGQP